MAIVAVGRPGDEAVIAPEWQAVEARVRPGDRGDDQLGGHVKGLQLGGLTAEEALALERPAMTYVRERLVGQLRRAWRRWLHPTSGRRSGDRFL